MAQGGTTRDPRPLEEMFEDMKAVVCSDYSKISVKVGNSVSDTSLLSNKVVVNVKYCGINFADIYMVNGIFIKKPLPFIVGLEVSGKIVAVGSDQCGFYVGENVVVYLPDGGAFMEYLIVDKINVYSLDKVGLTDLRLAASVFVNYLTAYEILNCVDFRKVSVDDSLLFIGCSGGVGLATADLLEKRCNIIGVCSESKFKSNELQKHFKTLLCYNTYDMHFEIERDDASSCKKYKPPTIIVDTMAGSHIKKCLNLLGSNGVYIVIGASSALDEKEKYSDGFKLQTDLRLLAKNGISIHFINIKQLVEQKRDYVGERANELFMKAKTHAIQPYIYGTYKSSQIKEALNLLSERINIGKVVVEM